MMCWNIYTFSITDQKYKTSIVEYYKSINETAEVLARAIGNALGMSRDKSDDEPNRTDRDGNICYDGNAVMDKESGNQMDKFSPCSKQDFRDFYNLMDWLYNGKFCMERGKYLFHNYITISFFFN